jgi:hypothetical protein
MVGPPGASLRPSVTARRCGYGLTCVTPDGKLLAWSGDTIYEITGGGRKVTEAAKVPTGKEQGSFDPGVFTVLRSGRWIVAAREEELTLSSGHYARVGRSDDGYDYYRLSGVKGLVTFRPYYSDDQGKTWQGGERGRISNRLSGHTPAAGSSRRKMER